MSSGIEFDDSAARRLEATYLTTDVVTQRLAVHQALDVRSGETILDIGSGPGLLVYELGNTVGSEGRVCGIDTSEPMLEMGRRRCEDRPQCRFELADASKLPFTDGEFDAVVSTQVYEYVADIATAFAELHRVTRPGGRICIIDTDYNSLVIHTEHPERMQRVLDAWDHHFVHADLPRKISPALAVAGFEVGRREAIPMFNPDYNPNAFSYHLLPLMGAYALGRGEISREEMKSWLDEFAELGARGEFFYSINRYLFAARKKD